MPTDYSKYTGLDVTMVQDGIIQISMRGGDARKQHTDLSEIWLDVDRDPDVRVALAGGSPPPEQTLSTYGEDEDMNKMTGTALDMTRNVIDSFDTRMKVIQEASDLVYNILNCRKAIVALYPGTFAPVALHADVTITAKDAVWMDSHVGSLGVVAGDHAVMSWPLHMGMAKAKYYLLTSASFTGEEAAQFGLVALAVEADELEAKGLQIARILAAGSQRAIRWTKQTLNHHYRMASPTFDASLALEAITLGRENPDVQEGISALIEGREPKFPN
jgi:enoyl-CoA hydratase